MSRVLVPEHVVYRTFVEETVVLNLRTGQYHGLNPTAGRMLDALAAAGDIGAAADAVALALDTPLPRVRADLEALCVSLVERGLLERAGDG